MHNDDVEKANQPATRGDLERFAAKIDLDRFATKADLERFATKADLERFATKADLERFATKVDLERFATKDELSQTRRDIAISFDKTIAMLSGKMETYHGETSRSMSTLTQAVLTLQGMFQRVDNDQAFTRRRLDQHDGRLRALERRRKP
jgi:hypothetical protein